MDAQPAKAVVDRISIVQMQERYGLATRQAVYDRLKKLNIKSVRGTIDAETELPRMDELHQEMQEPKSTALSTTSTRQVEKSTRQLDSAVQPEMMLAMFEMLAARSAAPGPGAIATLKERLELLELCCQQGNTLATSELAEVLGISRTNLRSKGHHFQFGYLFLKAGRHGREVAWSVQRHTKKAKS